MLGIKKSVATSLVGVKRATPMQTMGHKTYGTGLEAVRATVKSADNSAGIVNESNSKEVAREPIRGGEYKPPVKRLNLEKPLRSSEQKNKFA